MEHQLAHHSLTVEEKKISLVTIILLIGVFFIACFATGAAHLYFHHRFIGFAQLFGFLILGVVYLVITEKKLGIASEIFLYTIIWIILLLLLLTGFQIFKEDFQPLDTISYCSAFIFPTVVLEAWKSFELSSHKPYYSWIYSNDIPEESGLAYFEKKPVRIKVITDSGSMLIKESLPSSLKTGEALFYGIKRSVSQQGEAWKQLFVNADGQPYEWQFYKKSFGGKKSLNPDYTVHDNSVKANSVIVAKRLS